MSGYIGTQPVPQATQTRDSFTATSGQVSFSCSGYTPNFLDVFLNGVKLASADYTATNGSDVVLASGAATGDILEVVAYTTFTVGSSFTPSIDDNGNATALTIDSNENVLVGKTSSSTTTAGNELRAGGLAAFTRSGSYSLNLNRLASNGDIAVFQKDGTTVGSIGVNSNDNLYFAGGTGSTKGIYFNDNGMVPADTGGSPLDNGVDLGVSNNRWKDLYLSGGVYLGGTGSANKLDDYESGSFTANGNWATNNNKYIKVGDLVTITMDLVGPASGSHSQFNLPFTCNATSAIGVYTTFVGFSGGRTYATAVAAGSVCYLRQNGSGVQFAALNVGAGHVLHFSLSYYTTA
tara:strand:+ start:1142 stop:2188 length:1047 start_codon:yes stop_codon:yes gene_type:complete